MKTLKEALIGFAQFVWFAVMLTLLVAGCFGGFCAAFLPNDQQVWTMIGVILSAGAGVFMSILTDRYVANNITLPTK